MWVCGGFHWGGCVGDAGGVSPGVFQISGLGELSMVGDGELSMVGDGEGGGVFQVSVSGVFGVDVFLVLFLGLKSSKTSDVSVSDSVLGLFF